MRSVAAVSHTYVSSHARSWEVIFILTRGNDAEGIFLTLSDTLSMGARVKVARLCVVCAFYF